MGLCGIHIKIHIGFQSLTVHSDQTSLWNRRKPQGAGGGTPSPTRIGPQLGDTARWGWRRLGGIAVPDRAGRGVGLGRPGDFPACGVDQIIRTPRWLPALHDALQPARWYHGCAVNEYCLLSGVSTSNDYGALSKQDARLEGTNALNRCTNPSSLRTRAKMMIYRIRYLRS